MYLNDQKVNSFLDSGNTVGNALSERQLKVLGIDKNSLEPFHCKIRTARRNTFLHVLGRVKTDLHLRFAGSETVFKTRPLVIQGLAMDLNLSLPFLVENKIDQLHSKSVLNLPNNEIVPLTPFENVPHCPSVYSSSLLTSEEIIIPAWRMKSIPVTATSFNKQQMATDSQGMCLALQSLEQKTGLEGLPTYSILDGSGNTFLVLANNSDQDILLEKGRRVGTFDRSFCPTSEIEDTQLMAVIDQALGPEEKKTDDQADEEEQQGNPWEWPVDQQRDWLEKTFKLSQSPLLKGQPELHKQAEEVLLKNIAIFGLNDTYGLTNLIEHDIPLEGDHKPIREPYRPCNPNLREDLKRQLEKWLRQDVIETSRSPWNFCLVASMKKNNKIRWCLDLRKLNNISRKDAFSIPNIEDLLSRLAYSKVFTVLDLSGAFHVIKIKKEDREKTSFNTCFGAFQHKRLCFGLANAPATFARLISQVLQDIPNDNIYNYLDDTLIGGNSLTSHLTALDAVLCAYKKAGLTLQPEKCTFFSTDCEFLGHRITADGISPLDRHLQLIQDWAEPTNVTEVKSFLGKVGYYRKSIKGCAQIALPLTNLTSAEKTPEFHFGKKEKESFQALKDALTSPPVLAFPRFDTNEKFILATDWCSTSIGAALLQKQDGREVVIQYGSRKLGKHEQNMSSNKGELLAALYFMRKWRYYLQYKRFILRTDHEALRFIKSMDAPRGFYARWLQTLSDFDFEVEFRRGKNHANIDALSRLPNAPEPTEKDERFLEEKFFAMTEKVDVAGLQREDPVLQHVHQWLKNEEKPPSKDIRHLDDHVKSYHAIYETLYLDGKDIIWRKTFRGREAFKQDRMCLPDTLQDKIITSIHEEEIAHLKMNKTQSAVLSKYYFPGAYKRIEMLVRACRTCKESERKQQPQRHTHATVQEGTVWAKLSIDLVGPLRPSPEGHNHILTVKCCFSRYLEAFPTHDITAQGLANILEREIFARYGASDRIHSDNGSNVSADLLKEIYKVLQITPSTCPPYNAKSSNVERSHRELGQMLKAMCIQNNTTDWQSQLRPCTFALNTSRNRSTGMTPYFLMFGREARTKTDLIYGNLPQQVSRGPCEHANQMRDRLQSAYQYVRFNLGQAIERTRKQYTQKDKDQFKPGDLVYLCTPRLQEGAGKKFSQYYSGPYRITEKLCDVLFRIVDHGEWNSKRIEIVASIDRLSHYWSTQEPMQCNLDPGDLQIEDEFLENIGETTITSSQDNRLQVTFPEDPNSSPPEPMVDIVPVVPTSNRPRGRPPKKSIISSPQTQSSEESTYQEIKDCSARQEEVPPVPPRPPDHPSTSRKRIKMGANLQQVTQGAQQLVRRITRSLTRDTPPTLDDKAAKRQAPTESVFSEEYDTKNPKLEVPKRPATAESLFSDEQDNKQPKMDSPDLQEPK